MLCELEVNNIGTYVELITRIDAEQQYRMWFRGQSDYSWGLVPSVQRKDGMGEHYEQYITTNFMIHTMLLMRATHSGILPSTYARTLPRFPEKSGSIVLSTHGTKAASTIHTTFASIASNAERPTCAKSF